MFARRSCLVASSIVLALVLFRSANAQAGDWNVVRISGDSLMSCTLISFDDTVLVVGGVDTVISVPLDSLAVLSLHKDGQFLKGAEYGTIVGALLGGVIGAATHEKPEPKHSEGSGWFGGTSIAPDFSGVGAFFGGLVIGAGAGFVVGGVIGASVAEDQIVDFTELPQTAKIMVLRQLVEKGKP